MRCHGVSRLAVRVQRPEPLPEEERRQHDGPRTRRGCPGGSRGCRSRPSACAYAGRWRPARRPPPAAMNQFSILQTGYSSEPSWNTGVSIRVNPTAIAVNTKKPARRRFAMSMMLSPWFSPRGEKDFAKVLFWPQYSTACRHRLAWASRGLRFSKRHVGDGQGRGVDEEGLR